MRATLPAERADWSSIEKGLAQMANNDIDWRAGRIAVFVFHPGDDVLDVAKDAYGMFQSENGLGAASAFPSLKKMEDDVVDMGLDLLHAPEDACGSITSGGSESIFLAVKSCRQRARARGVDTRDAEIIMPRSGHPAFDKAAHYLDLKTVRIPVDADYLADTTAMHEAITDKTIMIVGSAPCYPYGLIDPITRLSEMALEHNLWLHVDACVGGYFAPFARMNGIDLPEFDFRVEGVNSISADLHKYGYAAKGASTLFHRHKDQQQYQVFSCSDWACGEMKTPSLAGTRPGGSIASAWAVMNYLGVKGYCEKVRQVTETRERLCSGIQEIDGLQIYGKPQLGLMIYGSVNRDTQMIWQGMYDLGWFSPPLDEPPSIHLMLSPGHADHVEAYLEDLNDVVAKVAISTQNGHMHARYT